MSEKYLPQVRAQYEDYPYPPVNPQDEKKRINIPFTEGFPAVGHYCFSGLKDPRENCRYLVAGGGTGDAVIGLAEQLRDHPSSTVVYVDISKASQEVARERARIRKLEDRIEWHHGSLLDVAKMGIGEFDYINSSGVLHHLADPQAGLDALVSVLKPGGVLSLMLYAAYGRTAVYQMQETLRYVNQGVSDQQQQVENAKAILGDLPTSNWMMASPQMILSEIGGGDAAIYDLLLHTQDRAYTIPELYAFLDQSKLEMMALFPDDFTLGKKQYDPQFYVRDEKVLANIRKLPQRQQEAFAELMNGKICKHTFYAARKRPGLPSISNPEMVPFFDSSFVNNIYDSFRTLVKQSEDLVNMSSSGTAVLFPKTQHLDLIAQFMDGMHSMQEIYDKVCGALPQSGKKLTWDNFVAEFALMYNALNEYSWLLLRHKSIPPYPQRQSLQDRIMKYFK